MRKIFIALIAVFALVFVSIEMARPGAAKQKTDAVDQVQMEKSSVTPLAVDPGANLSAANEVAEYVLTVDKPILGRREVTTDMRPLKPDSRRDSRAGSLAVTADSHGHRTAMRVLTP